MSDLRAPDPTLTALDGGEPLLLDHATDLPVAHLPGMDEYPACDHPIGQYDAMEIVAQFACWFAVPCLRCFPNAPEAGHPATCDNGPACPDEPHPHLSWQVPS